MGTQYRVIVTDTVLGLMVVDTMNKIGSKRRIIAVGVLGVIAIIVTAAHAHTGPPVRQVTF